MTTYVTGEEAVMMWTNMKAGLYGLTVTDFNTCWNDGKIVCAIIHSLFPTEFDYKKMTFANPLNDVKTAFVSLKKHGIIIYCEPEDFITPKPDTKSVTLFASELMQYATLGDKYVGEDEKLLAANKQKRIDEDRKEIEEAAKRKQEAIDALPKCVVCNNPISTTAWEFCGYPFHDTCMKCFSCEKPIRFKAMAIDCKPFCELCARNVFQRKKLEGWVPAAGVKGPVQTRIGKFTEGMKMPERPFSMTISQSETAGAKAEKAPQPKQQEPKKEVAASLVEETKKEEPTRKVIKTYEEDGYVIELVEETLYDPEIKKYKKRTIKRKTLKATNTEDDEMKKLEEEERKLNEQMAREEAESNAEMAKLDEEMKKQEEEIRKQEEELARQEEENRKQEEAEEEELRRMEEELNSAN
ncbi:hypothetical protein EIN_022370 [Entamoeba invadens IP1]|uniref:hypothetical protein n=1 Tax=Entamoeba invadens IP1 TaxID=370355 RepID=UPI0002C3D7C2|nr:hypothetical protein EIN_022370 [Entamoeba invadens IP1]ELP90628.1 hypothetical protein EIN_022370 [Entamoeba invadens IP1]|eukprot:XP_004257399.1 hypothetical protein EIN_022370 [Entamoeba invadens IP1]